MKNKLLIFSLLITTIISCNDDILEQTNPNSITPASFWLTAEDAEKGIIGAYSPLSGVRYYGRMFVFASDYRDDIVNGYALSPRTSAGSFQGTSTGTGTNVVWEEAWKCIVRSNLVLANVPNIEMDETKKQNILGEALFIRSLAYFDLLNLYRNIPLITTPISVEEANTISQSNPNDVFAQLATDLQEAKDLLPPARVGAELGRATSGAAAALLAKVYLSTGNYTQAETILRDIVSSNAYSLVDDYGDNFRSTTENNSESVFEIQLTNNGNRGWGGDNQGTGRANSVIPDIAPPGFTNQNGMRINQWVLDLFLDEQTVNGEIDPRTFYTMFWNTTETTNYEGVELSSKTYTEKTYTELFPATDTRIFGNKYVFADAEDGFSKAVFHQGNMNWRLIRYSDVLLYFAEAIMQGGANPATQEAVDAVNKIRSRADMPLFDLGMTWQDVMDERVKELSLEHTRYYDLLRWGMVKERIVDIPGIKSESAGVGSYQPGREYMDIPQKDLDVNKNLNHNPGYSN